MKRRLFTLCAALLLALLAGAAEDRTFRRAQPSLNTLDPAFGADTSVNCAM